jgi:chitinase
MHFLTHPEEIGSDGYIAFAAGLWFYMTPQSPKPSMHDVTTGFFEPNSLDIAAGYKGGFGSTTNIINGGIECGGGTNTKAENRGRYFLEFLEEFGIDTTNETDLGCATEGSFPVGGAGSANGYFQNGLDQGNNQNECKLVSW